MNSHIAPNVVSRTTRARRRQHGFTSAEVMIAVAVIAVLAGLAALWFLPARRTQEDRQALAAITSIYAAKQAYLELHPGTDPTSIPTEEQIAPLLAVGGKQAITPRAVANTGGSKVGLGTGDDRPASSYPVLNGMLPSRYRVVSIGAFNANPTLNPAPPDPIAAPPLALGTGTIIISPPIKVDPVEEEPGGTPGGGGAEEPIGIELPVGPIKPKDTPPKGE